MIREDKFLISHAPYAVDLDSFQVEERGTDTSRPWYRGTVTAIWYRRKHGVVTAHFGTLWDSQTEKPADAEAFLRAHDDGRYGGDCKARWNGQNLWAPDTPWERQNELQRLLSNALDYSYPAAPPGFDGWWTFKTGAKS